MGRRAAVLVRKLFVFIFVGEYRPPVGHFDRPVVTNCTVDTALITKQRAHTALILDQDSVASLPAYIDSFRFRPLVSGSMPCALINGTSTFRILRWATFQPARRSLRYLPIRSGKNNARGTCPFARTRQGAASWGIAQRPYAP